MNMTTLRILALSGIFLWTNDALAAPAAHIGSAEYESLPLAAAAAQSGDVIRVVRDLDWGKSFLPTGSVVTVDLDGHRINHYFWLSSGGTLRNGELVPHAGWSATSFYGDGVLDGLVVTNAPSDSALVGCGREGVTVEIRSGDYTTGALLSTADDTAAHYRLRITGGRFAARLWHDPRKRRDANISIAGGKWAYDPTPWLANGCKTVANPDADAEQFPYTVTR